MTTLVVYPDTGSGSTTVDGHVRRAVVDETWATIHGSATATNASKTSTAQTMARVQSSATTNQFSRLDRGAMTFDTSSIPSEAAISSATLSVVGTAKLNEFSPTPDVDIVNITLTDNNNIVTGDYDGLGTTVHVSMAHGSYSASGNNDFTLPTTAVTKAGITALGVRLSWDTDNSAPTWAASKDCYISFYNADNGSNQPTLTVVYTTATQRVIIVS